MAKLNGCIVPDKRECEVCNKILPTRDIEWCQVQDHPSWLACSECRVKMQRWKPLHGPMTEEELISMHRDKPVRKSKKPKKITSPGVPDYDEGPVELPVEVPVEGFTIEIDDSFSLDDL